MKKSILSLLCVASLSFAMNLEDGTKAFESKDYKTALKVFDEFSLKGDAIAEYKLGKMYDKGERVEKDYKKAKEWFEKAASQGYADAQYSLGNMYKYGRGVEKDSKKAKKLFKEACDGGHQDSCKLI